MLSQGLIVEDHRDTRERLARLLGQAFPGIGLQAVACLAASHAHIRSGLDIALLDLELPDGSGLSLIPELLMRAPGCHIIIMSLYGDDQHLFPALRAGAQGYLLKSDADARVIAGLQQAAAGEVALSPAIAMRILGFFSDAAKEKEDTVLSPRERETLTLVAKGYKIPEVAVQLGVAQSTAQSFVKRIYQKLSISSRAEAAIEAARRGLVGTLM